MADHDFQVIAVAVDEAVDKIREFMEGITYPVLLDVDHVVTELYAISNVPTVILIDGDDTIIQPNWSANASDTFKDFTGIDSTTQLNAIRRWVIDGEAMMDTESARAAVDDLSHEEEQARLHFRLANHLRGRGDEAGSERHFEQAGKLAPHDWTIRRASMPLRGGDPFGAEFFELYEEFKAAGTPYHGVITELP